MAESNEKEGYSENFGAQEKLGSLVTPRFVFFWYV
jgi:hypothetical protein